MKGYKLMKERWKPTVVVASLCLFTLTFVRFENMTLKFKRTEIFDVENLEIESQVSKNSTESAQSCQVVFTIGLEGVGHHGFVFRHNSFLQRLLKLHLRRRGVLSGANDRMFVDTRSNFNKKLFSNKYSDLFSYFREKCHHGLGMKECYSTPSLSFPDDRGPFLQRSKSIKSAKRWNPEDKSHLNYLYKQGHPINIEKFYLEGSNFCEVKFILLHRNLAESVLSHEDWDTGWKAHREILLMFARYINSSLGLIPKEAWTRINYEDFWLPRKHRNLILDKLATFLNWQASAEEALNISNFRLNISRKHFDANRCSRIQSLEESQKSQLDVLATYANPSKHPHSLELTSFEDSPSGKWFNESCAELKP